LLLALAPAVSACDGCGERPGSSAAETEEVEPEATAEAPPGPRGILRGVVRLPEGAELPAYPRAMVEGGAHADRPAHCPPPQRGELEPVSLADTGRGLGRVMVTVTSPERDAFYAALGEWEPARRELTIRRCRLDPPVVSATQGDVLVLANDDDYPFLPRMGEASFMQVLMKGEPREIPLERAGVQAVQCAFAAPCGRADVIVGYHPLHTLTEADGAFALEGVPRDVPIVVHAWHPLFQEATAEVRFGEDGAAEVELALTPRELPEPAEAEGGEGEGEEETPEGPPEDQPGVLF
ncbi:MAG TPA: hypothetical protein RMI62_04365, partial [Polyangiaceae bacterium LLY-WYZ-15_(1-7)]|nr:hypothetical protein [Polyangiaceae bacterium LLY-WYZ-15_(1-7)]